MRSTVLAIRSVLLPILVLMLGLGNAESKAAPRPKVYNPGRTATERWVWTELKGGRVADLSLHCHMKVTIHHSIGLGWADKCRALRGDFVASLMIGVATERTPLPRGIHIKGARVTGPVDLSLRHVAVFTQFSQTRFDDGLNFDEATLDKAIVLDDTIVKDRISFQHSTLASDFTLRRCLLGHIDGTYANISGSLFVTGDKNIKSIVKTMILDGASVHQDVDLSGSLFNGNVRAYNLRSARLVMHEGSVVSGGFMLQGADIGGDLDLVGSTFKGGIDGDRLHVGGGLFLFSSDTVLRGTLSLPLAMIDGRLELQQAQLLGGVDLSESSIKKSLMADGIVVAGRDLSLSSASIGGNLSLDGARFDTAAQLDNLHVSGNVYIRGKSLFSQTLGMSDAKVDGFVEISDSIIRSDLDAHLLVVGSSLIITNGTELSSDVTLHSAHIGGRLEVSRSRAHGTVDASELHVGEDVLVPSVFDRLVDFSNARIGGDVSLTDAALNNISLSGATIAGGLLLVDGTGRPRWEAPSQLLLRNAKIGFIRDGGGASLDAWPLNLDLDGTTYDRFDSLHDADSAETWLERDLAFTLQPYAQLVSVVRNAGDPDRANDILYLQRDRETVHKWNLGACGSGWGLISFSSDCWKSAGLFMLKSVIGFGLGNRVFLVFVWVGLFTILGLIVLLLRAESSAKGPIWCAGASLSRLLPVIELNKEFGEFFFDPERKRLNEWQLSYFAFHAVMGYVLGLFVVAAFAGLTQTR